jgi:hypothetical protein
MALKIANQKIKQRWLQAMDMWFYWIQDRVIQGQFHIYFGPSNDNLVNYFTKHHTATHHWWMQPVYLYTTTRELASSILWGQPAHSPQWQQLDSNDSFLLIQRKQLVNTAHCLLSSLFITSVSTPVS